jgi:hypothetical protein
MAESRDANDPRDQLRAMRKEARAEFEGEEARDTGGQERATPREREGDAGRGPADEATRGATRATAEQDDADALRVPRGDEVTGGGRSRAGPGQVGPAESGDE